jgi:hypothetical protein
MTELIVVAPIEGGWCVQRGLAEPWTFGDRPEAEWSARRLGELLAEAGAAAEIRVLRPDGAVESRFVLARTQETSEPLPA